MERVSSVVQEDFKPSGFENCNPSLLEFIQFQLAVAVGIELSESFGQRGHVATFRIPDELFHRDRAVPIPVATLEELFPEPTSWSRLFEVRLLDLPSLGYGRAG